MRSVKALDHYRCIKICEVSGRYSVQIMWNRVDVFKLTGQMSLYAAWLLAESTVLGLR